MTKQRMSQLIFAGLLAATSPAMAASVGEFVPDNAPRQPDIESIRVLKPPSGEVHGPGVPGGDPRETDASVKAWVPRSSGERIEHRPGLQESHLRHREGATRAGASAAGPIGVGGRFEPGPPVTSQPRPKPKPAASSQK